ncbi:hypothetical protein JVT61DRAFT_14190 [Boletus reticuloceps]|uniref:Uncharacterized protein n=1 Tax=Boletus reticuloceps TaxID=495285 RepID=A0A8I3A375_9AGAM|nr:hypothetical protein JVT61DRAFT_14190 [Boletus reticuloceps]
MKTVYITPLAPDGDVDNSCRSRSCDNLNNSGALPALPQKILCDDAVGRRRPLSSITRNIVVFGESGVGKSSLINLIADQTASSQIAQSYRSANPVSQPVPQREQPARFNVNGSARSYSYGSTSRSHVNRGWTEYTLPDGVRYYVNEDNRAITDLDLRSLTKLDEVSNTIDASDDAPEGCEMWIRAGSNAKKGWWKQKAGGEPAVLWVDHRHRRVLGDPSDDYVQSGGDDRLDDEYRYWAFIEMHPAHIPRGIVESARKDAIDVLHLSYADFLITHRPTSPFSQDEYRNWIKLFSNPHYRIIPAYTRAVAHILLRVARCRWDNLVPENVIRDAGPPSFLITTQCPSYESASTQTYPLPSLLSPDTISNRNIFRDVTAKDPEALLDTQNFNVTDASQTDPSIIATALITALGLLNSHSSNPKVAVFQLSAAAVSFTLIALHSFHSKTLVDKEQHPRELTLVQRLLKHFPPFILASCWILFLLSITFTFPKPMSVAVCLVVFASIPMVCGARLPAALTLAVITLFTLTFFTLVFLVCVLPTEWLA